MPRPGRLSNQPHHHQALWELGSLHNHRVTAAAAALLQLVGLVGALPE